MGVRRLIIEIHRRSLWQVLAIFIATSWAVLQAIDVLINRGMIPEWVFTVGFVLLLMGLPVVLATAFVQEGVGTASPRRDEQAKHTGPEGPVSAPAASRAAFVARHRLFTWRNAILGGIGAFALLGFVSAGYMGMRTFGIGMPGTLLAQGVLAEGAPVLLADFESSADAELGDVVTRTLLVDLLQSRTIRVLQRADVRDALERMQLDAAVRLSPALATEMAEREGYTAVITGNVAPAGSGYVLTASVVGGADFRVLAAFRETARSDDELVMAIERLSRSIRDKAGESLRSVRGGASLAQVTTSSLPALRAYTRAFEAEVAFDLRTALQNYERAVELDSTFAMGHRKVAATLQNLGIRPADMRRAARRAWELSHRLPALERQLAIGAYHNVISGDVDAEIHAYEQAVRIDSTNASLRNSLGNAYRRVGRGADAIDMYVGALREQPIAAVWFNLAGARFENGDYEAAMTTLDSALVLLPDFLRAIGLQAQFAFAMHEYQRADSLAAALESRARMPSDRMFARRQRFQLATMYGRLREAERILAAPGAELFMADPANVAVYRSQLALLRGDTAAALRIVRETAAAHKTSPDLDVEALLEVAAEAGSVQVMLELHALWDELVPANERGFFGRMGTELYRGRLAHLRGDHDAALAMLQGPLLCRTCASAAHYAMARVYDDLQQPHAAIAAYRDGLAVANPGRIRDVFGLPYALRRLAELYDVTGDTAQALEYYARFVDLWKDADPELQPQIGEARERIEWLDRMRPQ